MVHLQAQLTEMSAEKESLEASMSAKDDELERLSEALKVKEEAMGQAMGGLSGEKEELQKTIDQLVARHQEELEAQGILLATKDTTISELQKEVEGLQASMQTIRDDSREKFGQAIEKLKTMKQELHQKQEELASLQSKSNEAEQAMQATIAGLE